MKSINLKQIIKEEVRKVMQEAYFPSQSSDTAAVKSSKKALANWFNSIGSQIPSKQLDVLSDLIDEYADAYAESRIEDERYDNM